MKLYNRYHIPPKARAVGRLTQILEHSGMERGQFEDSLAAWEDAILKYEKATNSRLSDDVKIAVLMNKTRGQLQEHLRLNAASLTRYHEVKKVVTNYTSTKQTVNKDPTRTQMQWTLEKVFKGKGTWKGKGQGKARMSLVSHVAAKAT